MKFRLLLSAFSIPCLLSGFLYSDAAEKPQQMYVFVPRTDDQAARWLAILNDNPGLKLVLGISPAFNKLNADPALRQGLLNLQKAGRIQIALQIPNAPVLPLIINSDEARYSLPPGSPLPNPPFQYPADAVQIIGRTKADFYKSWQFDPAGLILPFGAASTESINILPRLHIDWAIGALGASPENNPYRIAGVRLWDASPSSAVANPSMEVWDERLSGPGKTISVLQRWAAETKDVKSAVLPFEITVATDWPANTRWAYRSWTSPDWSSWIGSLAKNQAWSALRRTREAVEKFKDSGASEAKVDIVFTEMYAAESAGYLSETGEPSPSAGSDERAHEFEAALNGIFRLIGQEPPDLYSQTASSSAIQTSTMSAVWQKLPNGNEQGILPDTSGDDIGDGSFVYPQTLSSMPGVLDLKSLEIDVSTTSLEFVVTLGSNTLTALGNSRHPGPLVDIYMDLNHQPQAGTISFLEGRGAGTSSEDAWEYALALAGSTAILYRTHDAASYEQAQTFPLQFENNRVHVLIPRDIIRGNPQRWGYQVLVMVEDPDSPDTAPRPAPAISAKTRNPSHIYDLLDPSGITQARLLTDLEDNRRNDIPFVRFPNN